MVLTQGLLTTLVVMYYFTLYYTVKPTHLSSRGWFFPTLKPWLSYFMLCCKKTTGRASTLLNRLSFNIKTEDFELPFIDDCTFIKRVFEQLSVVFWRRILYWSTGEGMDKMEFTVDESDCTTLVGESQQYKEPFLSTDRASAGEGESFFVNRELNFAILVSRSFFILIG